MVKTKNTGDLYIITGSGRSGTTLLSNLLNNHIECICGTENDFITRLILNSNKKGEVSKKKLTKIIDNIWLTKSAFSKDWNNLNPTILSNNIQFDRTLYELIRLFIQSYSPNKKASVLIDKNPFYLHFLNQLAQKLPDTKFLFIVRHPLDKFSSEKRLKKSFISYGTSWSYQQKKIISFSKKHPSKIIKYEDLILNPEKTLKEVCSFLKIDFEPSMLNNQLITRSFTTTQLKEWHSKSTQPIDKSRINVWKNTLTKNEIAIISFACRKEAKYFNYHLPKTKLNSLLFYIISFTSIFHYLTPSIKKTFFQSPIWIQKTMMKLKIFLSD